MAWLFRRRGGAIGPEDLKRHDFSTSTQRLGVHFSEHVRDTFRPRWLRRRP